MDEKTAAAPTTSLSCKLTDKVGVSLRKRNAVRAGVLW